MNFRPVRSIPQLFSLGTAGPQMMRLATVDFFATFFFSSRPLALVMALFGPATVAFFRGARPPLTQLGDTHFHNVSPFLMPFTFSDLVVRLCNLPSCPCPHALLAPRGKISAKFPRGRPFLGRPCFPPFLGCAQAVRSPISSFLPPLLAPS